MERGPYVLRLGISHLALYFNYESSKIQNKSNFSFPFLCADEEAQFEFEYNRKFRNKSSCNMSVEYR